MIKLPPLHNDPFDRILICQALQNNLTIATVDAAVCAYSISTISRYQKLLENPSISPQMREKTLYQIAATLLWQWENHPDGETLRIHPPANVPGKAQNLFYGASYPSNSNWEDSYKQIRRDYQSRVDQIISELQIKFPQSTYIDDLLFSNYYLSGKSEYLQQIVQRYPNSDRATPAKFLLENRTK